MTAFMIYLLVGSMWSLLCKISGEIDKQLDEQGWNTTGVQVWMFIVITLGWAPILVSWGLGKRKGE
ncbi:hypothetical protein A6E27_22970 [Bacillus cereus]|nr:hypothetical protein A6E27_22970 [Bacillus cereus]